MMSIDYYEKRIEIIKVMINRCLTLLMLKRQDLEAIPLSDFQDLEISLKNTLFQATKPRQVDE